MRTILRTQMRTEVKTENQNCSLCVLALLVFFGIALFMSVNSTYAIAASTEGSLTDSAVKSASELLGPINAAHDSKSFIMVYGTHASTADENVELKKIATDIAKFYGEESRRYELISDTDFRPSMFGADTIYLIGHLKSNSVINEYYGDHPFSFAALTETITEADKLKYGSDAVQAKTIYDAKVGDLTFQSRSGFGFIGIWPQPHQKGQSRGYTAILTGTDITSLRKCPQVFNGPTDYVLFRNNAWVLGSKWVFTLAGFYSKSNGTWNFDESMSTTAQKGRAFFAKWLGWPAAEPICPDAASSRILFTDGKMLKGKFFAADQGRYIIKITDDYRNYRKGQLVLVTGDEIASVNGAENIDLMVYRPALAAISQSAYREFSSDLEEFSLSVDTSRNDSGRILTGNYFCSTPPISDVRDLFGYRISYTMDREPGQRVHNYALKLNFPVLPGEDMGSVLSEREVRPENLVIEGNGKYRMDFNHFPGPRAFFRLNLHLPRDMEVLSMNNELRADFETVQGRTMIFEWHLDRGEGLYFNLDMARKPEK